MIVFVRMLTIFIKIAKKRITKLKTLKGVKFIINNEIKKHVNDEIDEINDVYGVDYIDELDNKDDVTS